ncbi:MAG: response regulator [Methanoregula sp.]|nr:response regulator [Methanoregula sp.]
MDPKKILIVEDNVIVAMELQARLRGAGYIVTGIAATGDTAVQNATTTRPDLLLMDITLKGEMDGVETVTRIQKEYQPAVIYITAYSNEDVMTRAMATHPHTYLTKPFGPGELFRQIARALGLSGDENLPSLP